MRIPLCPAIHCDLTTNSLLTIHGDLTIEWRHPNMAEAILSCTFVCMHVIDLQIVTCMYVCKLHVCMSYVLRINVCMYVCIEWHLLLTIGCFGWQVIKNSAVRHWLALTSSLIVWLPYISNYYSSGCGRRSGLSWIWGPEGERETGKEACMREFSIERV